MTAPLSIVIPTLNSADTLPQTLASLFEGLDLGLIKDLIVADGGSSDATQKIAEDVGGVFLSGAKGRGAQMDRGRDAAKGDWLLFLHSDTQLSPDWSLAVFQHVQNSDRAAYFQLSFGVNGFLPRLFAAGANFRSRLGLPYGDQGLLISAKLFDDMGGYGNLALMEDVALVRRLRGKLKPLPITATTSPAKYERDGWFRRGAGNLWALIKYLTGSDPADLAKRYYR